VARYTGPVCRLCRRSGEKLFLKGDRCMSPKCAVEKGAVPPGEHGNSRRRRRPSEYAIALKEKQRAKIIYGVLERQFSKYFAEAAKRPGSTGVVLLQMLERRLDNAVFRLGLAESRAKARQIVSHGHISINGRKTDVPSYLVKVGDAIGWVERSTKTEMYKTIVGGQQRAAIPKWLSLDAQTMTGKVVALPEPTDMDLKVEERLIVELYSR